MAKKKKIAKRQESRLAARLATGLLFFMFLGTLILFLVGWNNYLRMQQVFITEGVTVQGKVIDLFVSSEVRGKTSTYPIVEFTDQNHVIHSIKSKYAYSCHEGDLVQITYAADNPEMMEVENAGRKIYNIPFFLVILATFLFASFLFGCALFYTPKHHQ